jgi:hypothetical protein
MRNRHWVEKFENGEYLRKWRDHRPGLINGIYDNPLNIGEEKFHHCTGSFYGIGDVEWWITEELNKLSDEEKNELDLICSYKEYVKDFITFDKIKRISNFYNCETHNIYRIGTLNILNMFNDIVKYGEMINKNSKLDTSFNNDFLKLNDFDFKDFETFKTTLNIN